MNASSGSMRISLAMALTLISFTAFGNGARELRKQAEASMLLTGTVEVTQQGALRSFQLDHPEQIELVVRDFVERNMKGWSFEVGPLPEGISASATIRNSMSILVVAKPVEGDTYELRLGAIHFRPKDPEAGTEFGYGKNRAPVYPRVAGNARVEGKVFLLIKISPDGTVADVLAEQVNLGVVARNEKEMERWRAMLAASAVKAARLWTFTIPTRGELAHKPFHLVRVPVEYSIQRSKQPGYGEWASYIPGPRHLNQWEHAEDNPGFAPDALAANGGVYSIMACV